MRNLSEASDTLLAEVDAAGRKLAAAKAEIGKVIFGQQDVVEEALITLLAGGHGLLIGVPGLAKSKLVETLGTVLGLDDRRVQFTPDLMPADITGSEVLEEGEHGRRTFRFIAGPVFCQLLMADEINRASPRTQSALLQGRRAPALDDGVALAPPGLSPRMGRNFAARADGVTLDAIIGRLLEPLR
jgi:MoxR-like ATPase